MRACIAQLFGVIVFAAACAQAQAQAPPVAGREYLVLEPARTVASADRIEVIEFFHYGCPVCYESQPHIAQWLARSGADVSLRRVPATTAQGGESFALTFYTLEAMEQLDRLHWAVYDQHHFDDRRLHEESSVLEWLDRNGVDAGRFRELRGSAEVKAKVDAAHKTFEIYDIRGVPSFAVDGRYVTSARLAGGVREMMQVVEHLVGRAREDRRGR